MKRHKGGGGFTVHDPSASDLNALTGYQLVLAEFSIDFRPRLNIQTHERKRELEAIFRFMAARIWPFDCVGIARRYGVSPAERVFHQPYSVDAHGHATDPRLPRQGEVLYIGHKRGYRARGTRAPTWAQVRMYWKSIDQGEALPLAQNSIRLEVTVDEIGLKSMGVTGSRALRGFKYRHSLSSCFRMLIPDAAAAATATTRMLREDIPLTPWFSKMSAHSKTVRSKLLRELALEGGLLPLMKAKHAVVDSTLGDTKANAKIGAALDNLRKWSIRPRARKHSSIPVS